MTNTNPAIAAAIAAAQESAAALVPQADNQNVAPIAANGGGVPMSLDSMMSQETSVDNWLKVSADGVKIGTDDKLYETLTVKLDMSAVVPFFGLTYGNPPIYEKSFDRVTNVQGRPWTACIQDAQRVKPGIQDYRSATLVFELLEDTKGKGETFEEGSTIGYALPYTGFKEFEKLYKNLQKSGADMSSGVFKVTLSGKGAANKMGNKYAIIQFSNVEPM